MLLAGFGSGGGDDPGLGREVEFIPGRQPHFLGARGGEDLKLEALYGGAVCARCLHRGDGLGDLLMGCPSSKQMGLLSVFPKGGSGSSLFDVKPLGVDGSSGGFGWSVC